MSTGIFIVGADEQLLELVPETYESEALLQGLLERYPSVLAGDQINPTAPRRWLLISREIAVPAEEGGASRWSLDHLFLDQDAIPTLVEVKRSSDTRIRREVVGQMFDYAANAVAYWPIEALQAAFNTRCTAASVDPEEELMGFLEPGADSTEFWQLAKTNLQAGRIRLVFVADEIPSELRRIIEFLNQQMDPAEVIGVEIRQYVGGGLRSLVPRVIGQTEQAKQRKAVSTEAGRIWTRESFLDELRVRFGERQERFASDIISWAERTGARLSYGKGKQSGSVFVGFEHNGATVWPVALWTYGKLEVQFQWLRNSPAFGSLAARQELQRRLNEIQGVSIADSALDKRPSIPLETMLTHDAEQKLLAVLQWAAHQIRDQAPTTH